MSKKKSMNEDVENGGTNIIKLDNQRVGEQNIKCDFFSPRFLSLLFLSPNR